MTETVILKIDPSLPCAVLHGADTCDRPAHMAYAYPTVGPRPGVWLIMPVCDKCGGVSPGWDPGDGDSRGSQGRR